VAIVDVSRGLARGARPVTEINQADCLANDSVKLTLELQRGAESRLEVWAGFACEAKTSRVGPTTTCWRVHQGAPEQSIYSLELPVRDVLLGRVRAGTSEDTSDEAACEPASTAITPQVLAVYALLLDDGDNALASAVWKSTYRLKATPPPDLLDASSANGKLHVELAIESTSDNYIEGFQIFCEPQGASEGAGTHAQDCSNPRELVAGASGAALQHLRCGSAPKDATSATTDKLSNGVAYGVAIATVDTYGNISALSNPVCGIPQAREERSSACAFAGTGGTQAESALALVTLGAALARRRRRR